MEHIHINYQVTNNDNFEKFLRALRNRSGGRIALYMDQLGVHKSKVTAKVYQELDIMPIFNVSYSPELNPIEGVFSQVKRNYNKQRLNKLANGEIFDQTDWIRKAFRLVTKEIVRACIR